MKPRRSKRAPQPAMQVINLEAGMPAVPQALSRLADALRSEGSATRVLIVSAYSEPELVAHALRSSRPEIICISSG